MLHPRRNWSQAQAPTIAATSRTAETGRGLWTTEGERMIRATVEMLHGIEEQLVRQVGREQVERLRDILRLDWGEPPSA